MNGFIALLAESSVRIAMVTGTVAVIAWAARLRSGATRHAVWTLTMLAMLVMPLLLQVVPEWGLPVLQPEFPAQRREVIPAPANVSPPVIVAMTPTNAVPVLESMPPPERSVDWVAVLMGVYVAGVSILLLRLAAGWWGTRRLLRGAETAELDGTVVLISDAVATAVVCGVFRPQIVMPRAWREWPEVKRAMVLAHEKAHIRRRDPLTGLISRLNCALFWFHPVGWWLERKILASAEQACDDAVMSQLPEPETYAELLVSIADGVRRGGGRVAWDVIGMAGRGMLVGRVERLLSGDAMKETSAVRKAAVVVVCGGLVFLGASCTPKQESQSAAQGEGAEHPPTAAETRSGGLEAQGNGDAMPNTPDLYIKGQRLSVEAGRLSPDLVSAATPARICIVASSTCFEAPKEYGFKAGAELVEIRPGRSAVLFRAVASASGSGSSTALSILDLKDGRFVDLAPDIRLSEQSEYALWKERAISDAPILVTADYLIGVGETHFSRHRFRIRAYILEAAREASGLPEYILRADFVTDERYPSLDETDRIDVLSKERTNVLAQLRGRIAPAVRSGSAMTALPDSDVQRPVCQAPPGRAAEQFRGRVSAGERFSQTTPSGWQVRLAPVQYGWMLQVGAKLQGDDDYSRLTPPWHGVPNPRQIEGWHFRNADNTGPNGGSVNAPQQLRQFIFSPLVGHGIDYNGSATSAEDVEKVREFGQGWLFIDKRELSPEARGKRASIQSMDFTVCLTWPAEAGPPWMDQEGQAVARVKHLDVKELDPKLGNSEFRYWFAAIAANYAPVSYEQTDCGEQTGGPPDEGRVIPICVEVRTTTKSGAMATASILVGNSKLGALSGKPVVYYAALQQGNQVHEVKSLGDLARGIPGLAAPGPAKDGAVPSQDPLPAAGQPARESP